MARVFFPLPTVFYLNVAVFYCRGEEREKRLFFNFMIYDSILNSKIGGIFFLIVFSQHHHER